MKNLFVNPVSVVLCLQEALLGKTSFHRVVILHNSSSSAW